MGICHFGRPAGRPDKPDKQQLGLAGRPTKPAKTSKSQIISKSNDNSDACLGKQQLAGDLCKTVHNISRSHLQREVKNSEGAVLGGTVVFLSVRKAFKSSGRGV